MALDPMYRFTRRRRTTVSTLWSSGTSVAVQGLRRAATSSSLKLMVRHPLRPATSFSCHYCSAMRLNCLFYCVAGIILVHDLNNVKSYDNLWKWITEALTPPKKTKEDEDIDTKKRDSAVKMREADKARGQALSSSFAVSDTF